ncbi:MAG: MFS transporter [Firmicutes bacterium]|nr:MFS transporter [Bacillota bacterium]
MSTRVSGGERTGEERHFWPGVRGARSRSGSGGGGSRAGEGRLRFEPGIVALAFVPFVMVLGNSILIPVLPAIREALRLTEASSGLVITAFSVPAGLFIPLAGFLADRFGRKAVMVPSLAVYALGGFVAVGAALLLGPRAFAPLMVGRVIQGLGAAGTANIAMALAGDLYRGAARNQALGVLEASNGLGKVASPVLGAALGLVAWFAPFVFFAVLTVPVTLAVAFLARDVKPQRRVGVGEYFGSVLRVFSRKGVPLGVSLLAGMTALFLLFGVLFYLSEILEKQFHLEGVRKGLVLAVPVLASSAMAYVSGTWLQKRVDRRYLVAGGLALITLALATLAVVRDPYYLFGAIFLVGAGSGTALAALDVLVTSAVPQDQRGMITSDYGAVRFFGVALGPPAFGLLMGRGDVVLFVSAAALGALSAALSLAFIRQEQLMVGSKR